MTDIRDSNAALTGTAPLFVASGALWSEWIYDPAYPLILEAGDGLALRTQVVMPATQTWSYSYTASWNEGPAIA